MVANKKINIVFTLPGLEAGGAERVLITFMNSLDRSVYNPVLISVKGDGALRDLVDADIPVYYFNEKLKISTLPKLYNRLRVLKPEIVVSTMAHMNFAVLVFKPLFYKTKFIIREAITPSFILEKFTRYSWLLKRLYTWLYPQADIILSPSQKVFDEFQSLLGLDLPQQMILKNSVDVEAVQTQIADNEAQDINIIKFVACGRLHYQKGFDRLIIALAQAHFSMPWRLDILGEGEERQNLEALIQQYNLSEHIFLQGLVMPPYDYFADADYFVMPSRYEGLPNVVLESLACGTPVIATAESGGIQEVANDCNKQNVIVVDDMDTFVRKMEKACKKTQLNNKSLLPHCCERKTILSSFNAILQTI